MDGEARQGREGGGIGMVVMLAMRGEVMGKKWGGLSVAGAGARRRGRGVGEVSQ